MPFLGGQKKLTYFFTRNVPVAKSLVLVTSVNILPKRLKISKHTNFHTVAKCLMLVTSVNILPH